MSIPVVWTEDGGAAFAGRLDVHTDRLHLDGGSRNARETRDVLYTAIASARIGRTSSDRVNGRPAMLIDLRTGGTISLVGFDRPGMLAEVLGQLQRRAGIPESA